MSRGAGEQERELIAAAVARLRAGIMALVLALVGGGGLFLATVWLLIRGGPNVGQHLGLLANYYPGYSVSWWGAVVGLAYGALTGGIVGWSLAWTYNRLAQRRRGRTRAAPPGRPDA